MKNKISINYFKKHINKELKNFDKILKEVVSTDIDFIRENIEYILFSGGKRIRPTLNILLGMAVGIEENVIYKLSSIIELIHNASLIHDDIIDFSLERRGIKTLNAIHPHNVAILIGDFMLSRAMSLGAELSNNRFINETAKVTTAIFSGEIEQNILRNEDINEKKYFDIIIKKTGTLIGFSAASPLIFSKNGYIKYYDDMYESGTKLGMAFQIIDDIMDIDVKNNKLGKPVLKDLESGQITLPLIYSFKKNDINVKKKILGYIKEKKHSDKIIQFIYDNKGIEESKEKAKELINEALKIRTIFPNNKYVDLFNKFCIYLTDRDY